MDRSFGVIIVCCMGDFSYAKGAVASVRHFMPGVPVCLLIDGPFYPEKFIRRYDLDCINRPRIRDPFLREHARGSSVTKMIALWESPYERFLLMDADTVLWGDVRPLADFSRYDFIADVGPERLTPEEMNRYMFDPELVKAYQPDFEPAGLRYFCAGVFFGTRGLIPIEEFRRFIKRQRESTLFKCDDQGWLNFMLLYGRQTGRLRLDRQRIQFVVSDYTREETRLMFGSAPGERPAGPVVIHWAGSVNPLWRRRGETWAEPMFYFRRMLLAEAGLRFAPAQNACMWWEEWTSALPKTARRNALAAKWAAYGFAKAALRKLLGNSLGGRAIGVLRRFRV